MKYRFALLLCLALRSASAPAEPYDLVIRHGRVVDGSGNPAFFADVAVKDGRIAAIGNISGEAKTEIDATGMIVTPGFIDVHTHADEIAEMPRAENFVRMGVTTVVAGNCGGSTLDVAKLFRAIEQTNVAVNVATLVGHNDVRKKAMGGSFDRPPTPEEAAILDPDLSRIVDPASRAVAAAELGIDRGVTRIEEYEAIRHRLGDR